MENFMETGIAGLPAPVTQARKEVSVEIGRIMSIVIDRNDIAFCKSARPDNIDNSLPHGPCASKSIEATMSVMRQSKSAEHRTKCCPAGVTAALETPNPHLQPLLAFRRLKTINETAVAFRCLRHSSRHHFNHKNAIGRQRYSFG